MEKFPMTPEGEKTLRDELNYRKNTERPRISKAIGEARELGDLKENAEYHSAREEQGFNEARIRDIEAKLSNAQVIDVTALHSSKKVIFGVTVTLINVETDETVLYKIVGEDEANIKAGKVSVTSPIARSLIGKEEGETVFVNTPSGQLEFEIDQVQYI
ncbi:MAG: transcription elongation factor GreA [Endozoicomonadaceae bacterium]|nr:transcription elongation factor GreA [Endozoicomonadaceae bacterium]